LGLPAWNSSCAAASSAARLFGSILERVLKGSQALLGPVQALEGHPL
jgi:hypothetical protein